MAAGPSLELSCHLLRRQCSLVKNNVGQFSHFSGTIQPGQRNRGPLRCSNGRASETWDVLLLAAGLHHDAPRSVFAHVLERCGTQTKSKAPFFRYTVQSYCEPFCTHERYALQEDVVRPHWAGRELLQQIVGVYLGIEYRHLIVGQGHCSVCLLERIWCLEGAYAYRLLRQAAAVSQSLLEDFSEQLLPSSHSFCRSKAAAGWSPAHRRSWCVRRPTSNSSTDVRWFAPIAILAVALAGEGAAIARVRTKSR
mmetsp:Transcript_121441/g.303064  ORF Transcript_121441/g.303064 Transcript_121441/m.303064 type:complete len:252 (-) Transcript_121441:491-1246(-)